LNAKPGQDLQMDNMFGRVAALAGSQMTVTLTEPETAQGAVRIGGMVKARAVNLDVVGTVAAVQLNNGGPSLHSIFTIDLLGEIAVAADGRQQFSRGVSHYPLIGTPVYAATEAELKVVYSPPLLPSIGIGTLYHNPQQTAFVLVNELLAKNFAKSCAITLILSEILREYANAHIVLLDLHNEYTAAFGDRAEVVNVDNLQLPFWLLDFEEAVEVLIRGGTAQEQEAQAIILKDAILRARRRFAGAALATTITVDTPTPFKTSELLRSFDEAMGRLDNPDTSAPYLRLMTRLESLRHDRRFAFMFSDRLVTRDTLSEIVSRLLRIPVAGKPLTIIDLSGIPSEIADVVVSLSCRLTFDFALWSERDRMPPILLVCEEAHRYVPADPRDGPRDHPTRAGRS